MKREFGRLGITFYDSKANYLFFEGTGGSVRLLRGGGDPDPGLQQLQGTGTGVFPGGGETARGKYRTPAGIGEDFKVKGEQYGKGNYDTGNHVQCRKKPDRGRPVQDF